MNAERCRDANLPFEPSMRHELEPGPRASKCAWIRDDCGASQLALAESFALCTMCCKFRNAAAI
jgi:hypothetical protein